MSTQIDLGPVLSIPKGDWNASTTYERLNLVRHNSAAWICNVDTSIGVEPSEDSADWFLQVKDTSAVSSVNGMRGDVEITSIQTPSNDSNDTSIANTEWVRDRIDETISSAHLYTDSAISTATTSILDTAAQDASNKATTAVNQALAASETKFATKEVVSGLADNIGTLAEHNAAQDTAIAGKLSTSGGTIKSGANLNFGSYGAISGNTNELVLRGGDTWTTGAGLVLRTGNASAPGSFWLKAQDQNGTECGLFGRTDKTLTWCGNSVLTSAGGTMNGVIYNPTFMRNNLSGQIELYSGTNGNNGAYIALYGQSCTEGYGQGKVLLRAANKGTITDVTINPGGGMYINGKEVTYLTASWRSGNNWYRKYNDGWIEQGGYVTKGSAPNATVAFHTPFANTNYFFTSSATPGSTDASGGDGHQNRTTTGCTIIHTAFYHSGAGAYWYACGY